MPVELREQAAETRELARERAEGGEEKRAATSPRPRSRATSSRRVRAASAWMEGRMGPRARRIAC